MLFVINLLYKWIYIFWDKIMKLHVVVYLLHLDNVPFWILVTLIVLSYIFQVFFSMFKIFSFLKIVTVEQLTLNLIQASEVMYFKLTLSMAIAITCNPSSSSLSWTIFQTSSPLKLPNWFGWNLIWLFFKDILHKMTISIFDLLENMANVTKLRM